MSHPATPSAGHRQHAARGDDARAGEPQAGEPSVGGLRAGEPQPGAPVNEGPQPSADPLHSLWTALDEVESAPVAERVAVFERVNEALVSELSILDEV